MRASLPAHYSGLDPPVYQEQPLRKSPSSGAGSETETPEAKTQRKPRVDKGMESSEK